MEMERYFVAAHSEKIERDEYIIYIQHKYCAAAALKGDASLVGAVQCTIYVTLCRCCARFSSMTSYPSAWRRYNNDYPPE